MHLTYLLYRIMRYTMSILYTTMSFIFIPLFVMLMTKLKSAYFDVYESIVCKASVAFAFFEILMVFRLGVFLCIEWQYIHFFQITPLHALLPFYISEIIISLTYILTLRKVYNNSAPASVTTDNSAPLL